MKIETNVTIDVGAGNQPLALTMQEALELADAIYKALGIKIPSVMTYPSNGLTPRAYPSPTTSPLSGQVYMSTCESHYKDPQSYVDTSVAS